MKKFYILVNSVSGKKKGADILKKIQPVFAENDSKLTILNSEYPGHAKILAGTLDLTGYNGLCAIGGDGTMSEMVNGILNRKDNKLIPLGLIAGGTGNAFMHDLDCLNPLEAVKRIIDGKLRPIDVAKVVADKMEYYSFNIIGWGLAADAANMAEGLRWFGGARYNIASIIEVILDRKKMATLVTEGVEYREDFVGIIACNTIHTGKGMRMAPHAKIDDGKIDLLIVRKGSRLKLLNLFSKLFSGKHINNSLVEYKQVDRFSIIPDVQSKLNIDGELIGNSPVHVEVKKKRVNVLV